MARQASIEESELLNKLSDVFRDVGYHGASLALLAKAAGLQKASLYHRFPGGKEQMAKEVLKAAGDWVSQEILTPLDADAPPKRKITAMVAKLDELYSSGEQACLLNMLSSTHIHQGPFTDLIKGVFEAWIETLSRVLTEVGLDQELAQRRSERALMLLQGSLVLSRGMGTTKPFKNFLKHLPQELLEGA